MATRTSSVETRRPARTAVIIVGMAAFAWIASGFASFSWQATGCVLLGGVTVIIVGLRRAPADRRARRRPPGVFVWMIWTAAFLAWWGSAFLTGSRPSHPTLSLLLDPVLAAQPMRAGAYLAWLLGGWALVRR